ncbi:MAG: hypothetical protein RL722_1361, partial [Pseudomonadota bacterium]
APLLGALILLGPALAQSPATLPHARSTMAPEILSPQALAERAQQVREAELGFARSMAQRRLDDFARHVSIEALFFSGDPGQPPLRGQAAVVEGWRAFFNPDRPPPFSWAPDQVAVLASGELALSTGLVRDPEGRVIGRFNSIWRLEAPGHWRVVFDKGSPPSTADPQR